jgi:phage terminase small subunit
MAKVPALVDDELPACLKALPNERWRVAVVKFCDDPRSTDHGAKVRAVKAAGYEGSAQVLANRAQRIFTDPRVIEAINELMRKELRNMAPAAVNVLKQILHDPLHKDRLKAADKILERFDPVVSKSEVSVTHRRELSPDELLLKELRDARAGLGFTREQLINLFGRGGLDRAEQLEALEAAEQAKVIEADYVVVEPAPEPEPEHSAAGLEDLLGGLSQEEAELF